jgi:ADP-heptose:LPS heptosyltransferase
MKRISNYFNVFKEIPLLIKIELKNRNKPEINNPKRILIINTCLVGDFAASLHAIKTIIDKNKNSNVDLIVSPPLKPLAEKINGIKKVYTVESLYNRKLENGYNKSKKKQLKNYDIIISMRNSKKSYELIKKIKYKKIISSFYPYIRYSVNLTKGTLTKKDFKQWREFNFDIIKEKDRILKFKDIFRFEKSDYKKVMNLEEMKGKSKKIIIHTRATWEVTCWDNENWTTLIKKINKIGNFRFIFVGTDKEKKDFEEIQKKLDFKLYSLIDKINTAELALVMKKSDFFIGIDSGPRNLANLVGLKSINLLGPGQKIFMPTNKNDIIIDKSNCRCTNLFCYKKKTCMQKINPEEVFLKFKKLIKN